MCQCNATILHQQFVPISTLPGCHSVIHSDDDPAFSPSYVVHFFLLTSKDEINLLSTPWVSPLMYVWHSSAGIKARLNHEYRGCGTQRSTNFICTLSRFVALSSVLKRRSKSAHCHVFHNQKDFMRKYFLDLKLLLLSDLQQLFLLSAWWHTVITFLLINYSKIIYSLVSYCAVEGLLGLWTDWRGSDLVCLVLSAQTDW